MEVYLLDNNNIAPIDGDETLLAGQPVDGTCPIRYDGRGEQCPAVIGGIAERVQTSRRGPSRYYGVAVPVLGVIPRAVFQRTDDLEVTTDFIRTFNVEFKTQRSPAEKRKMRARWERAVKDQNIVINADLRYRANVTVVPKPTRMSGITTNLYTPSRPPCGNPIHYLHPHGKVYTTNRGGSALAGPMEGWRISSTQRYVGGLVNKLPKSYNQAWADQLCADISDALTTQLKVDTGLATTCMAAVNARGVDTIANLGEIPETVIMVTDLVKAAVKLKKGKVKEAEALRKRLRVTDRNSYKIADAMAQLWMGYRYGVQPLAMTIEQIVDEWEKKLIAFQTDRVGQREALEFTYAGSPVSGTTIHRAWNKRRYHVERHKLHQMFYLDWRSAAWELLPVSFITDWFLNVGDVVNACGYPDFEYTDRSSYSWRSEFTLTIEHDNAVVVVDFDHYHIKPTRLAEHIGLTLDPAYTLKRKLDTLALSWFAFRPKHGLGGRTV